MYWEMDTKKYTIISGQHFHNSLFPNSSCRVSDAMQEHEYAYKRTDILVMGREHMVMK